MKVLVFDRADNNNVKELTFNVDKRRPTCICGRLIMDNPNDEMVVNCSCGKQFEIIE